MIEEFLKSNSEFINTMFSVHYPFSEDELIKHRFKLIFGSNNYSHSDESMPQYFYAKYGLNFNQHIVWTKELQNLYYHEPIIVHGFGSTDVYSIRDFDNFPLSIDEEINFWKSFQKNHIITIDGTKEEFMIAVERDELYSKWIDNELSKKKLRDLSYFLDAFYANNQFGSPSIVFNKNLFNTIYKILVDELPNFSIENLVSFFEETNELKEDFIGIKMPIKKSFGK